MINTNYINFTSLKPIKSKNNNNFKDSFSELRTLSGRPVKLNGIEGHVILTTKDMPEGKKALLAKLVRNDGEASKFLMNGTKSQVDNYIKRTSDRAIYNEIQTLDNSLKKAESDYPKSLNDF